jgi:hypothetical protein
MRSGAFLISASVRLALLCYASCLILLLWNGRSRTLNAVTRTLWTAGALLFVVHVAAALHFTHQWDHQAAIRSTAEQTKELLGWAFGEGLYFSYLFVLLWLIDLVWVWFLPAAREQRSPWIHRLLHCYLFFIAFNGAVVFEAGVTRPAGIVASLVITALLIRHWSRHQSKPASAESPRPSDR